MLDANMNYLFFLVIGLYHISIRYKMIPLVIRITDKYTIIPDFEKEAMYFPKRITFFTRSTSVGCLRKAPGFLPMSIGGGIRGRNLLMFCKIWVVVIVILCLTKSQSIFGGYFQLFHNHFAILICVLLLYLHCYVQRKI